MTVGRALWVLPAIAWLAGCRESAAPTDRGGMQALQAALSHYVAAANQGDANALAALYAEDAVLLPPDHEPIEGRRAIEEFWRQGTDQGLEVATLRVEVAGDLAYVVGRYSLPQTDEEPADSGKYVMCLKRQRDGTWKLTADIWNSSSGAAEEGRGPQDPTTRGTIS